MRTGDLIAGAGVVVVLSSVGLVIFDRVVMPLVVHAGSTVRVPDVVEFTQARAETLLTQNGFQLVVDGNEYDQSVLAGAILSQNPAAFAVTKKGRRIHVVVSRGPRMVAMADLTGISLRQAEMSLKDLGLERGHVFTILSAQIPGDVVMKQSVAPGEQVPAGTMVDLTVSAR